MQHIINLATPNGRERRRGFQPPWYTVFIYKCEHTGKDIRVRANAFRGKWPVPSVGGIICPHCERNHD